MAVVVGAAGVAVSAYGVSQSGHNASTVTNAANQGAAAADPGAALRPVFQDVLMSKFPGLSSVNYNDILKDPSFQFLHDTGMRDLTGSESSAGLLRSGTRMEDISTFNQGLASTYIDKQFQRQMQMLGMLGNFSGLNTGQPGVAGQILANGGVNAAGYNNQAAAQLGGGINLLGRTLQNGGVGTSTPNLYGPQNSGLNYGPE